MSNTIVDIFRGKELRERIFFTFGMLVVFRIGAVFPIPGINVRELSRYFMDQINTGNPIVDYLDFFAGGAFSNFSVFMLGIMPYISMSIIMQLLLIVFPALKKISQEEGGRKKIQKWQRYGTIAVCLIQSFAVTQYAQVISRSVDNLLYIGFVQFSLIAMLTVTTGTMFLMWIGEQITKRGIGNGISLLIYAGIVARLPQAVWELINMMRRGDLNPVFVIIVIILFVTVVTLVVYEQRGERRIKINQAKMVKGRKMYGGQDRYLPLKINPSGVIPVIFASSILTFPLQIAQSVGGNVTWLASLAQILSPRGAVYNVMYVLLIIFFAYFYTQVSQNPIETAKQIRESGGSIPTVRTDRMAEYLTKIQNRIVLPGSMYLALIAVIPTFIQWFFRFPTSIAYLMGGTSLLILVSVNLETMKNVEMHMTTHNYDGFLGKKGRSRNRKYNRNL